MKKQWLQCAAVCALSLLFTACGASPSHSPASDGSASAQATVEEKQQVLEKMLAYYNGADSVRFSIDTTMSTGAGSFSMSGDIEIGNNLLSHTTMTVADQKIDSYIQKNGDQLITYLNFDNGNGWVKSSVLAPADDTSLSLDTTPKMYSDLGKELDMTKTADEYVFQGKLDFEKIAKNAHSLQMPQELLAYPPKEPISLSFTVDAQDFHIREIEFTFLFDLRAYASASEESIGGNASDSSEMDLSFSTAFRLTDYVRTKTGAITLPPEAAQATEITSASPQDAAPEIESEKP